MLAFCGYLAYRLIRWLWPIFEKRKDLTPFQMLDRAIMAPMEEQQRQATKYGSRERPLKVHLVNFVLLLAWGYFARFSQLVFWGLYVYQGIGLFVLRLVKVPAAPLLVGLNAYERFWLRVFYAWLWPLYIPYLFSRK